MKDIFTAHEPRTGKPTDQSASADVAFVSAGLVAAFHTKKTVRETILSDVSNALNCKSEDLEFLFSDEQDDDSSADFDFPDAERRRRVMRENRMDAAE